jgi:1,3-beta-glucan synthase
VKVSAQLCTGRATVQGTLDILGQMLAGSLLFFIFRQQTSAFYFTQIAYYGGAKYIATGRGFALTHTPYVKTFSNFGRSHIYFGFQLGLLAVMLAFLKIKSYFLSTWGVWLVSISLTFAPLWFNPQTFVADVAWADFKAWRNWMLGAMDEDTKESWRVARPCPWLLYTL